MSRDAAMDAATAPTRADGTGAPDDDASTWQIDVPDVDAAAEADDRFEALYRDAFVPMVRLATLLCGNQQVATDVVQDAFVKVHVRWSRIRTPEAYLRRSVVNGCRSHARREYRRRNRVVPSEDTQELGGFELLDVLATLPPRQRAAIVLRFYEQRSEAEIASFLGCRPGSVGPMLTRSLRRLRHLLDPEEGAHDG
ncbi:MAG: sigma-70 family RNA polymerase sigma factor [Actinomycetota bacterium]